MIGVVIPAHNEEVTLRDCLRSVVAASRHEALEGEPVKIVLVLDRCTDASAQIAERVEGITTIEIAAGNVGLARATGAQTALERGARWLAFTDADSEVCDDWLVSQLACGSEVVCGTVHVTDWSAHDVATRARYESLYSDRDGHRHIHGANLGIGRDAYLAAGGFRNLLVGEDVALVQILEQAGHRISWSAAPRVATSARKDARVSGGFCDYLRRIAETVKEQFPTELPPPLDQSTGS